MEVPTVMSSVEVSRYIEALELPDVSSGRVRRSVPTFMSTGAFRSTATPDQSASVVTNNLIAFVGDLSHQSREDVEHSFLLASLGADKAFSKDPRQEVWYASFIKTLGAVGWVFPSRTQRLLKTTEKGLTMDALALKILSSIAGTVLVPSLNSVIALKAASSAFNALSKHEGPLKLFTHKSITDDGGGFQTGVCVQTSNGGVQMAVGALRYNQDIRSTKVLFWEWATGEVETFTASSTLSLSSSLYALNRELVVGKVSAYSQDYILNLDI